MGRYLDIVKRFEARSRTEHLQSPVSHVQVASWLCPHCGRPATIEDVFPSLDGERTLTMWSCEPCQVVAVTPNTIKEPPIGWAPKTKQ
jgi:hypothetical protein